METINNVQIARTQDSDIIDFDWGQLTWFASGPLGNSKEMTVGRCIIKPGCSNPAHTHPNCEEVLTVIEGKISHSIGPDQAVEMSTGDTISVPQELVHNATNIGDTDAVLFICFSSADRKTEGE